MKSLASLVSVVCLSVAVGSACSKTDSSPTICPSGFPQTCLGAAADTCYCTPVSTCDYCAALFNATPGDSDSRCDAYRGQGASCQSTADCQTAAGAGVSTKLVCHTGSDAYASQCVLMCSADSDCPSGEQCAIGATSSGGVCGRACTASVLYLDAGPDTGSVPDSSSDAGTNAFEAACGTFNIQQSAASSDPDCNACLQAEIATCQAEAGACIETDLPGCQQQCASIASVAQRCTCIEACAANCAPEAGVFYACVAGACGDSCQ